MVMAENTCEDVPNGQFRFEDGELVLSDNEPNPEGKGESEDASNSRKSRRKQTFERRNIKKVREDALSEEAKAAQKAEMERRKRLGKDHVDHTKFSNIEFLLNDGLTNADSCMPAEVGENNVPLLSREVEADETSAKRLKTAASECLTPLDGSLDSRLSEVVIKPEDETLCRMNVTDDCTVEELVGAEESSTDVNSTKPCDSTPRSASLSSSASANLFGSWRAGQSRDDAILLGDSDDEQEKHMASDVIELSDGEEEPEEPEVETEICELQDAANLIDERGRVVLNPNRDSETECEICLPPQIARVIKPHQVSGIRFLYDNVIENQQRFETTDGFGCILAHSMGLGKTIQIIGFLDTIFRYCNVKRVLVIVPINTIQNWQAEFELWLPTDRLKQSRFWSKVASDSVAVTTADTNTAMSSGEITEESTYDQHTFSELFSEHSGQVDGTTEKPMEQSFGSTETVPLCKSEEFERQNGIEQRGNLRSFKLFVVRDVVKTMTQRHQIVNQWFEEGGVLLLGYEMFRLLLNQKRGVTKAEIRAFSRRKKKTICLDLIEEERREKMLADFHAALIDPGPQLVICDEGHRIKNSEASISKALKAIKTRRRVVLTGYPLQNNLMEYWCMVDFVRPSYLGTKQEFTNMFQRPIENGQCIDSTPEDRKVMQGRAHVLHDLLSGFVQRRSHVVLKASLPPKTEIVLLIKLSPLQRTLYAAFMKSLNSSGPLGWAQVNTLKTYAMCCKIWNHPDILWRAMEEHKEAMDFDIEDPSNSASSTAYSNRGLTRSATTSALSRRTSSQLSLSSSEQSTATEKSPAETPPASSTLNWPPYTTAQRSPNTAFTPPNPFFPTVPHSLLNRLTSPPSVPAYLYNQTQQNAPTVPPPGTYDWASDAALWGPDYKPGNVEHSGKIILFLSLLEGCVLAGDKILVFTQSLYTLDLLERILRRLPLPVQKFSEAATSSTCDGQPVAPGSEFKCTEDCDTDAKMYAVYECRSIKTTATGPDESSESANNVSLPEIDHHGEPVSTKNRDICEEQANSLDDSQFLESVLGHSGSVVSDEPTSSCVPEATEHQQITKREPLSTTFEQVKEEEQPEETLRSLHYRLASRLGRSNKPSVWTKNVHYFRLDGSTTASEREKLINNFNDPKNPAKLFLVSTRAGCLGVNLIGANRVVVFDASWNPCHDCQAVCRVYRYGQVKPCYIYRLVSDNTMEKKIYDRQVTKQGMSDRVVDELNPSQQFTRSQVELLMSFEDKDMQGISQEDLQNCSDLVEPDPVLSSVLQKHRSWITKTPFTHESLLIDRKDYRLTRVEKRLARQRYEQEKRLSLSYQKAHLFQFQQMQALQHQQLLAAGINPAQLNQSNLFSRTPSILSRGSGFNYRPTYTSGMAAIDAMRQVERQSHTNTDQLQMPSAWASNCKVTRIVATTDLYFPSTVENKTVERKIPKGEVMEVIQTSKGKYLRIVRTGDLFVVKTSSHTPSDTDSKADAAAATSSFGNNGASASTTPASVSSFAAPTCDSRQAGLSPPRNSQPELRSQNTDSKTPVEPANPESTNMTSPTSVSFSSADVRLRALFSEAGSRPTVCPPTTVNAVHDSSSGDMTKRLPAFSASEPPQTSVSTTTSSIRLHHPTNTSSTYPSIHHMDHAPTTTTSSSTSVAHQPHSGSTQNQFSLSSQSTQASKHFEARSRVDAYQHHFDQQYFGQLAQRQQHQQTSSWICPNCGLPATSCTCNTPSGIANDSDKSASRVSAQHPLSPTSFGQQSSCSSFALSSGTTQPASPKQERKESRNNAFVGSTNYGSVATSQFYSPEAVSRRQQQQQQQQEYLRAAEEVARQSAAAYLHFNKQQLSSSQGNQHSSITPHHSRSDFNITSSAAHQQTSSSISGNNTNNSPVFPSIPSAPNPASMVHDYFAQLTGQPGHQSNMFHHNNPAGNSHPVAAAMQQYLVSNAGGSSLVHSDSSNFYANLPSQRQFESATQSSNYVQGPGATEQQQTRSSMVGQHLQQQQQPYQFPLMQSSSQMPPFDRLQSHRLLPNFRLP